MKWEHTQRSRRDYQAAPPAVQKAFDKQARFLVEDSRHPSLQTKKYRGSSVWQARVTRDWRFYFTLSNDTYIIVTIVPHPK